MSEDFVKLGLLRWLADPSRFLPQHHLGIVWFRVADEHDNADGKHVAYLDPSTRAGQDLRPLDPDLYDRLRRVVGSGDRSISALATRGALPKGTSCFDEVLSSPTSPRPTSMRASFGVSGGSTTQWLRSDRARWCSSIPITAYAVTTTRCRRTGLNREQLSTSTSTPNAR